jgi:hypothetical protein
MELTRPTCPLQSGEQAGLLLDYCARKLGPAPAAALEAHMEQCASCREFRDTQRVVWDSLDAWEVSDSGWDFNRRLRQRLEEEDAAPAWVGELRAWKSGISWKPAIPLAAALALWLAVFPPSAPNSSDQPAASQDQQIERVLEDVEMLQQLPLEAR